MRPVRSPLHRQPGILLLHINKLDWFELKAFDEGQRGASSPAGFESSSKSAISSVF
jgi:hypothetical protein